MASSQENVISEPGLTVQRPYSEEHFTIPNEVISQISCGDAHCMILCESGRVFAFGENSHGQCGLNPSPNYEVYELPTLLKSLDSYKIVKVACGRNSSFFVTSDGDLLGCGNNSLGQLGPGHDCPCTLPIKISSLNVKSVSASGSHFMVITSTDKVLVCGDNAQGQLGLGHNNFQPSLMKVKLPEKILMVSCGGTFNTLLSASGNVYTTHRGVLKDPNSTENVIDYKLAAYCNDYTTRRQQNKPQTVFSIVPGLTGVVDVASGESHTLLLKADGTVWAFGDNSRGQLGKANYKAQSLVRCHVPCHLRVVKVFAGPHNSGILTDVGDVYLWGQGPATVGKVEFVSIPMITKKYSNLEVTQVGLSGSFFVFLSQQLPKFELKKAVVFPGVSELEKCVMSSLECPVCFKLMSAPIHLCRRGHSLCGFCKGKIPSCPQCHSEFIEARNFALERQCEGAKLPCTLCLDRMPGSAIEAHLLVCPSRQRHCPLKEACSWLGKARDLLEHVTAAHPDLVWRGSPQTFMFSHIAGQLETRAWLVDNVVYILYWKFDEETRELQVTARQIGDDGSTLEHKLKLEFVDLHNNFQSNVTDIAFDTDPVNDVFTVPSCLKFHISENIQENICRASIVKREEFDQLRDQIVALALAQSKETP